MPPEERPFADDVLRQMYRSIGRAQPAVQRQVMELAQEIAYDLLIFGTTWLKLEEGNTVVKGDPMEMILRHSDGRDGA